MINLGVVQPAKPGSGDRAYSGLHGVWYKDRKAEEGTKPLEVFFAVTVHVILNDNFEPLDPEVMTTYVEAVMQRWIDWHKEGIIQIDTLSIRPDPMDQRPPNEQRQQSAPPPSASQGRSTGESGDVPRTPDGKEIKKFMCVKVDKERENGKTYVRFWMKNGRYPALRIHPDEKTYNKACEQLKGLTSIDWKAAELGVSVNCDLICGYTESDNTKSTGNPYWDFYGIRAK